MHEREELSYLCFVCDRRGFDRPFRFFIPANAFLKPPYELDPTSDLAGLHVREGQQGFRPSKGFFHLIHPIDEDENITKRNAECGWGSYVFFEHQLFHGNSF
jgi:hypothetical protein